MGGLVVALYMILIHDPSKLSINRIVFWAPAFGLNLASGWAKDLGFGLKFGFNLLFSESKTSIPVDHSKTFKNPTALEVHNKELHMLQRYSSRYLWKVFEAMNKLKSFGGSQKIQTPFIIFHGTLDNLVSQPASFEFFASSPIKNQSKYVKLEGAWHHVFSDPLFKEEHWSMLRKFLKD